MDRNITFTFVNVFGLITIALLVCSTAKKAWSAKEKKALSELRPLVSDILYRDYMKEDVYLIQWLRATNLDTYKADTMIRKTHKWRKEKDIETLMKHDWSKFEEQFQYDLSGHDLEGRPIMTLNFGENWNLRKTVLAGLREQYNTYLNIKFERTLAKARKTFNITVPTATGVRDVPDVVLIYDLRGYSARKNGCLACIPAVLTYASDADAYYSYAAKDIYLINVPRIFESLLQLIRNVLSPRINDLLKVYDYDKSRWAAQLLTFIAPDQLKPEHGGTMIVRENVLY